MSENDQAQATAREPEQREENTRAQGERAGEKGGPRQGRGGSDRRGRGRRQGQQHSQQSSAQQRRTEPSLNMDELRELAELFSAHGLTDFEFENEEIRVRLSRNNMPQPSAHAALSVQPTHPAPPLPAVTPTPAGEGSSAISAEAAPAADDLHVITSPIVGTFYRSPSPTAEPFIRPGGHVEPDTVVCIIEAMKLMNEILAETSGTVEKIYVENGQPVEYGQPLFGVKK